MAAWRTGAGRACCSSTPCLRSVSQSLTAWVDAPMCDKKGSVCAPCCPAVVVAQVRRGQANSHQGKGWESFTDAVVRELDARKTGLVFLLWGKPAQVCVTARVAWRPRGPPQCSWSLLTLRQGATREPKLSSCRCLNRRRASRSAGASTACSCAPTLLRSRPTRRAHPSSALAASPRPTRPSRASARTPSTGTSKVPGKVKLGEGPL